MGFSQVFMGDFSSDVLCIIKALGYHRKCDLALSVFEWIKKRCDSKDVIKGSVGAVIISMLGKECRVLEAASLLYKLQKDGFGIDVYAYTSMKSVYARNGRYREAMML